MKKLIALLLFAGCAHAQDVLTDVPSAPDLHKTHVIYLHGRIIENSGPRPTDPRFGLYDYPAVLGALASRGAVVISAQRKPNTDMNAYAGYVVGQVERLIDAGVAPEDIVVIGFSKGGGIAVRVSSFMHRPEVRFVLLAACGGGPATTNLHLSGRVLAINETSDTLAGASCKPLAERGEKPASFREIHISTGKSHGAFYLPRPEWVTPVLDFVHPDKP